ncbi:MAG: restriction endonuclease subunit S [Formivibrio sp.]|nr:restriction endonuclease subunit S [Formivibrio sp.]
MKERDDSGGVTMANWRKVRLGEICRFKYGEMPKKNDLSPEGYPVYSGYRYVGFSPRYHYAEPEIIVVARGEGGTGDIKMTPPFCFLTNISIAILLETPEVFKPFLFYRLSATTLWELRTGSAQAQITIEHLKDFEVEFPPLPVQRRIAGILSAYDELIANSQRRIRTLEAMARALYREWFVHFRFPGHQKIKMVDSPLGKIPHGWEVKILKDACYLTMGQSPKSEFYNETGEGQPFHQGVTNFGDRFPTDRLFCTVEGRVAEAGDILFSVRAPVGRMNIADKKIIIGRGVSAIRHKEGHQAFLWEQLRNRFTEDDMMGNGAIFAAVTKDDMQGIELICPPSPLVLDATKHFEPIHTELDALTKQIANLRKTRDLLLPRLLSGNCSLNV